MKQKFISQKFCALSLGVVGCIAVFYVMSPGQSECMPGEICNHKPPHDWKLKPFNGLDENDPIRRRFREEHLKETETNQRNDWSNSHITGRKPAENGDSDYLNDLFETKNTEPERDKEKPKIITKVKTKEIFVPQPCETDFVTRQKYVRNCVTNEIIGKIPPQTQTVPFNSRQTQAFQVQENATERRRSFQHVYQTNAWGKNWDPGYKDMNGSGRGATLSWTQELIATLHVVVNTVKATLGLQRVKLLDIPCGDMAWMSRFLLTRDDIDYTGIDIVPELITHHKTAYKAFPWKFILVDLLEKPLNQSYHLILNRMLLQHLYFRDVVSLLDQFSQSNSSFLLTTTSPGVQTNEELVTNEENPGRYRKLNLEIPPLSLSPPLCLSRDGPRVDFEGWSHFIGLWKLPLRRVNECSETFKMQYPGYSKVPLYSCTNWVL